MAWWPTCGYGDRCLGDLQLGTADTAAYGQFTCVNQGEEGGCDRVARVEKVDIEKKWDTWTLVIAVLLLALVPLGSALVRAQGSLKALFQPGPLLWTPAAGLGVGLAIALLTVYAIQLADGAEGTALVIALGLVAGMAGSLPIWWSFMKLGVHIPMKMSREAAWKVHIVTGEAFLAFGTAHGVAVFVKMDNPMDLMTTRSGLLGLVLMWAGILPVALHYTKLISYDRFKVAHFLSMLGYVITVLHMLGHLRRTGSLRVLVVTLSNIAALVMFGLQKVSSKLLAPKASVESSEVSVEPSGRHVFMKLKAPGFQMKPGQWGHLTVPAISRVPHPFTVVPGDAADSVRFFIKVSGPWTSALAEACRNPGQEPAVRLQGPYGEPVLPAPFVDAMVFVVGGVGVTPALSLLPEAVRTLGAQKVRLYWSLRSPALLQRSAPILQPHLSNSEDAANCIRLPEGAEDEIEPLPLGAQKGHQDLKTWLDKTAASLSASGVKSAMIFICGPEGLAKAAKSAAKGGGASAVSWFVHQEEFRFLPLSNSTGHVVKGSTSVRPGNDREVE